MGDWNERERERERLERETRERERYRSLFVSRSPRNLLFVERDSCISLSLAVGRRSTCCRGSRSQASCCSCKTRPCSRTRASCSGTTRSTTVTPRGDSPCCVLPNAHSVVLKLVFKAEDGADVVSTQETNTHNVQEARGGEYDAASARGLLAAPADDGGGLARHSDLAGGRPPALRSSNVPTHPCDSQGFVPSSSSRLFISKAVSGIYAAGDV